MEIHKLFKRLISLLDQLGVLVYKMVAKRVMSIKEIKKQSPGKLKYDPFLYVPRLIAPYLTKLFLYTPITANQISLFLYLLYIFASFLIAINKYIVLALVLLHVAIFLDFIDGRIARARKQTSFTGLYLEYTSHETVPPLIFFALGSYLYLTMGNAVYLYLGGFIVLAQLIINSFGTSKQRIMYHEIRDKGKVPSNLTDGTSFLREAKSPFYIWLLRFVNLLPNFGVLIYAITIGYIFGFLEYALVFYFTYFVLIAFFKVVIELIMGFKPYGLK